MAWLRRAVHHEELSLRNVKTIDDIINDLVRLGHGRAPCQVKSALGSSEGLEDMVVQLFPGSDLPVPQLAPNLGREPRLELQIECALSQLRPALPVDNLVQVVGSIEVQLQQPRSDTCTPGTYLLIKNPDKQRTPPFLLGVTADTVGS